MSVRRGFSKDEDPCETGITLGMFPDQRGRPEGTIAFITCSQKLTGERAIITKARASRSPAQVIVQRLGCLTVRQYPTRDTQSVRRYAKLL